MATEVEGRAQASLSFALRAPTLTPSVIPGLTRNPVPVACVVSGVSARHLTPARTPCHFCGRQTPSSAPLHIGTPPRAKRLVGVRTGFPYSNPTSSSTKKTWPRQPQAFPFAKDLNGWKIS